MKAAVLDAFGGPDAFEIRDVPTPTPAAGEVLVRVYAAGTNPVDAQSRASGVWAGVPLPAILGCDVSGVVEAVGAGVDDLRPGDEVFYMGEFLNAAPGGYAEYNVVKAAIVAIKPEGLSHLEAAALPLAACTAELVIVRRLAMTAGEWVMIHGASGGVGGYAIQIAKALGARVVACASAGRRRYLETLGADVFVDYADGDPFARAVQLVGGELDAVADLFGDGAVAQALPFTREYGRVATIVELQGDLDLAIDRNIPLHGVLVRPARALLECVGSRVGRGELRPLVDAAYPLEEISEVHRRLDSGHGQGKAVVMMPVLADQRPTRGPGDTEHRSKEAL